MTDAEKDHIRWMCKTQAGGHPSWEERAEREIATIEAAEPKPEPVPEPKEAPKVVEAPAPKGKK